MTCDKCEKCGRPLSDRLRHEDNDLCVECISQETLIIPRSEIREELFKAAKENRRESSVKKAR